ncbi:hypothetical protein GGR58DRAFT_527099 [Xylaria digitata]|nr:hypothetical protein GGR58DRAFT_527099 [Xylaria digitata]
MHGGCFMFSGSGEIGVVEGRRGVASFNLETTPLHLAARREDEVIARLLLEKGADPNARVWPDNRFLQLGDKRLTGRGWTALHEAAFKGREAIVKLLLENKADVHIEDASGQTALRIAASQGHRAVVQLLEQKELEKELEGRAMLQKGSEGFYDSDEELGDIDTEEALFDFETIRETSALLCQQLSKTCDLHLKHTVYSNLKTEHRGGNQEETRNTTAREELVFHIAMKRMDEHRDSVVWVEADFTSERERAGNKDLVHTNPPTRSPLPGNAVDRCLECNIGVRSGAIFCIGKLPIGMDFQFHLDSRLGTYALRYPDHIKDKRLLPPIPISEWLSPCYCDEGVRIRVARLVAELVLRFDPALWRATELQVDKLMIAAPGDTYEVVELHISVPIVNSTKNGSPLNIATASEGVVINRPELENDRVNWDSSTASEIWNKVEDLRRIGRMGDSYVEMVECCLNNHDRQEDIYGPEMPPEFYRNVVRVLKQGEVAKPKHTTLVDVSITESMTHDDDSTMIEVITTARDVEVRA